MFAFFAMVSLVAALLILPGWLLARKWHPQSLWFFGLPLVGNALWLLPTILHIGAQSLANVIEVFAVTAVAIVASYLKFFAFDRRAGTGSLGTTVAVVSVAVVALSLRLFMPGLPE